MACGVGVRARVTVRKNGGIRNIMYIPIHDVNEWTSVGDRQSFEAH